MIFVIKDVQPAGWFVRFSYVEEDGIVGDEGDRVVLHQFLNSLKMSLDR